MTETAPGPRVKAADDRATTTCRSATTASSATCTRSRWSASTARSTGTAPRASTRRACSARSSTRSAAATGASRPCTRTRRVKQLYFPDTNVLITRFLTEEGVGEVVDFMPVAHTRAEEHRAPARPARRRRPRRGPRSDVECEPRFDYGRARAHVERGERRRRASTHGPVHGLLALARKVPLERRRAAASAAEFALAADEAATFVLADAGAATGPPTPSRRSRDLLVEHGARSGGAGSRSRATTAAGARWSTARR